MTKQSRAFGIRQGVALGLLLGLLALLVGVTGSARLTRADFVLNNGTEVSTLDPASVSGVPEGRVMYALYEGLTVRDKRTLESVPGMAEAWEISDDGLTYTFHIREGARWSNGDRLTAHDFEWSWQRLLHPETAAEYAYQLWYVERAEEYSLCPADTPGNLWWFDETYWVNWVEDGSRARIGIHAFADESVQPPANAALSQALAERILGNELAGGALEFGSMQADGDPYADNWLIELEVPLETLAASLRGMLPESEARRELFWPQVGARATDDTTFVVKLASSTPFFLYITSFYPTMPTHRGTWEWARENYPDTWQIEWIAAENIVTNGPFLLSERRINDRIRLVKNYDYWDADNVALRTYDILAVEHYGTMLNLYLTGEVDAIDRCAPNLIPRMLPREDFNPESYLGTYFYRINTNKKPFDDKRVRRALALTIDRRAICSKITKKGEKPLYALSPDGLPGYPRPAMAHTPFADDSEYEAAFEADCAEAVRLLKEAGYGTSGERFPTFEIHYNTAEVHRDLAEVIAYTWKRVLDIDAKLLNQEWKVYLDTQNTISYDVSRSAWIGDYPDPNTFVDLFVTGGENNRTGWGNPRYDELVRGAAVESDPVLRLEQLAEAEAILLDELPILPIYSYVTQNIVNPRLGGFFENVMDDHLPKFFYWMDDAELAERRAAQPSEWTPADAPGPRDGLYSPNEQARRAALAGATDR